MKGFTVKSSPSHAPEVSGAYNTVLTTRDGIKVIRVLYFDRKTWDDFDHRRAWISAEVSEYGYFEHQRISGEYIDAWKLIEGVEIAIVPEELEIKIPSIPDEESDEEI